MAHQHSSGHTVPNIHQQKVKRNYMEKNYHLKHVCMNVNCGQAGVDMSSSSHLDNFYDMHVLLLHCP